MLTVSFIKWTENKKLKFLGTLNLWTIKGRYHDEITTIRIKL